MAAGGSEVLPLLYRASEMGLASILEMVAAAPPMYRMRLRRMLIKAGRRFFSCIYYTPLELRIKSEDGIYQTANLHFISNMPKVALLGYLFQVAPAGFNQHGAIWKDDCRDALAALVHIDNEFGGFFVILKLNFYKVYFVGFKICFCSMTVRAKFSGVHYDLGWMHII